MNRAERRAFAKRAPRGTHKFVERWLKDKCMSCLIGDHKHCEPVWSVLTLQFETCACGCQRAGFKGLKIKRGTGHEAREERRPWWSPWRRRRS